jgi:L-2-amino-thiazoline-4-carboxylic acid hydrolase-like protein
MPVSKRDEIFEQSRQKHLMTVSFLTVLKDNFNPETVFQIAVDGFSNYMKNYYRLILDTTKEGSQERFDTFRKHYESYAEGSGYCHIVESTPITLKVRFDRCPFTEVMGEYGLSELTYAFCLSDPAFTEELLPCVAFHREHVIAKGDPICDHTWTYANPKKQSNKRAPYHFRVG